MKTRALAAVALIAATAALALPGLVLAEEKPAEPAQKLAVEGTFVRIGFNDEGWVTMGFRTANSSVDEKWMLLEVGITVQKGVSNQTLTRPDIALVTPGPKVVPLASQSDFQEAGYLRALAQRSEIARDPINYFPPIAQQACVINFFADPTDRSGPGLARDQVELSQNRACVGRLFFHIPDGIQLGTYNLNVRFANSTIKVPFQIMTEEEAKEFEKKWKEARKAAKKK